MADEIDCLVREFCSLGEHNSVADAERIVARLSAMSSDWLDRVRAFGSDDYLLWDFAETNLALAAYYVGLYAESEDPIGVIEHDGCTLLVNLITMGRFEAAEWLIATFEIDRQRINSAGYIFDALERRDGRAAAEWLVTRFGLTGDVDADDFETEHNCFICALVRFRRIADAEWLYRRLYPGGRTIDSAHRLELLAAALLTDNIGVVAWVVETFGVTAAEFKSLKNDASVHRSPDSAGEQSPARTYCASD